MDAKGETKVTQSDRDIIITRSVKGPARLVYEAWANIDLFRQWWIPKSVPMTIVSMEADIRTGGSYRFVFKHPNFPEPMAFFGNYKEVTPTSRLVWTNEESGPDNISVSTVTFEEKDGRTLVTLSERFPTKELADAALAGGAPEGTKESFEQLTEFIASRS